MARRAAPSQHTLARIRDWFGLRQDELALYLAVSPPLVNSIEAGRRGLTAPVALAMLPLARHLPAPATPTAAPTDALPPGAAAPEAAELDYRRRVCVQRAARLRAEAAQLARQAHQAQRWAQALPQLLAPAPLPAALAPPPDPERSTWLSGWLHRRARPLPPAAVTRWHLLQAQAHAYETEAATLAALL